MIDVKGNFNDIYINNLECEVCNENFIQNQDHLIYFKKISFNYKELYEKIS